MGGEFEREMSIEFCNISNSFGENSFNDLLDVLAVRTVVEILAGSSSPLSVVKAVNVFYSGDSDVSIW